MPASGWFLLLANLRAFILGKILTLTNSAFCSSRFSLSSCLYLWKSLMTPFGPVYIGNKKTVNEKALSRKYDWTFIYISRCSLPFLHFVGSRWRRCSTKRLDFSFIGLDGVVFIFPFTFTAAAAIILQLFAQKFVIQSGHFLLNFSAVNKFWQLATLTGDTSVKLQASVLLW